MNSDKARANFVAGFVAPFEGRPVILARVGVWSTPTPQVQEGLQRALHELGAVLVVVAAAEVFIFGADAEPRSLPVSETSDWERDLSLRATVWSRARKPLESTQLQLSLFDDQGGLRSSTWQRVNRPVAEVLLRALDVATERAAIGSQRALADTAEQHAPISGVGPLSRREQVVTSLASTFLLLWIPSYAPSAARRRPHSMETPSDSVPIARCG
jgi:hypothetical protein